MDINSLIEPLECIEPKHYIAKDQNGTTIRGTAKSTRNEDIDPEQVRRQMIEVLNTVEAGFKRIKREINEIDCGQETLIVAGNTMEPKMNELANDIGGEDKEISRHTKEIAAYLNKIYEKAVFYHNECQKKYNRIAHQNEEYIEMEIL